MEGTGRSPIYFGLSEAKKVAFLTILTGFSRVPLRYFETFACGAEDPSFLFTLPGTRQKRERSCMRGFETVSFWNLVMVQNACTTDVVMN